jgi:hypothetical protein
VSAAGVLLLAFCGCAVRQPMVLGRTVAVARVDGGKPAKGELIAVEDGQLLLRQAEGPVQVPLSAVREVSIKRHDWGGSRGLGWSLVGGLVTGGALALSCSRVSSGCGGVGAGVAALWLAVGGLSSLSMQASSQLRLRNPTEDLLRPYARFPQGVPPGVDDRSIVPPGLRRPAGRPEADGQGRRPAATAPDGHIP